jgi:hypothetical protein
LVLCSLPSCLWLWERCLKWRSPCSTRGERMREGSTLSHFCSTESHQIRLRHHFSDIKPFCVVARKYDCPAGGGDAGDGRHYGPLITWASCIDCLPVTDCIALSCTAYGTSIVTTSSTQAGCMHLGQRWPRYVEDSSRFWGVQTDIK